MLSKKIIMGLWASKLCIFAFLGILGGTITAAVPAVATVDITEITTKGAVCGGDVSSDGGLAVTSRGVCWSTLPVPTTSDSRTDDGSGTGSFSSTIGGLMPGTIYYVRAFAINSDGTAYGQQKAFTTLTLLPTVETAQITGIGVTSATGGGNVTGDGGGTSVTARGVCWNILQNPTLANSHTEDGLGLGGFVSQLTGLSPDTTYYVRAYATNIAGTSYGQEVTFLTPSIPILTTSAVSQVTDTTALCGGNVTSDGGLEVLLRGVCWSTSENPNVNNSKTEDGGGLGSFSSAILGLSAGTTYYVRAYATNSAGTAYGEQYSFITTNPTVTLEILVSGAGSTTPEPGSHSVQSLIPIAITATPQADYHFVNWTAKDALTVADPNSASTTVFLTGNGGVTANFAHDTVTLSMTVLPADTGRTEPPIGVHTVNTYEPLQITALPIGGYYFSGWLTTGNVVIENASKSTTTATFAGDSIIVANFSPTPPETAVLTMAASPIGYGITLPEGSMTVQTLIPQTITSYPAQGKHFIGWTVYPTSNASVADSFATTTTATLLADATITANFSDTPPVTASLTMTAIPEGSGSTNPLGTTTVTVNIPQAISAEPADGYFFVKWTVTENATVAIYNAPSTTVTLVGDAVVTAEFSNEQTEYISQGWAIAINASDLGYPAFEDFSARPKVNTAKESSKSLPFSIVTSATKKRPQTSVTAEWTKKILLYAKRDYKSGQKSTLLINKPVVAKNLGGLYIQTKELLDNKPIYLHKNIWLSPPIVTDVSSEGGVILLRGRNFGCKAPKIYVECDRGGKWCYKNCKIDRVATYIFKNARGYANYSCMKVLDSDASAYPVGYSQVMVAYPVLPAGSKPSGYVIMDNGISLVPVKLPEPKQ